MDIAAIFGVTRENIYALCRRAGAKIPRKPSKAARLKSLRKKIDIM